MAVNWQAGDNMKREGKWCQIMDHILMAKNEFALLVIYLSAIHIHLSGKWIAQKYEANVIASKITRFGVHTIKPLL